MVATPFLKRRQQVLKPRDSPEITDTLKPSLSAKRGQHRRDRQIGEGSSIRPGSWNEAKAQDGSPGNLGVPLTSTCKQTGRSGRRLNNDPGPEGTSVQRCSAACILAEIEKVRSQKRYDPKALVDWCVKLARVAKRYAKLEQERPDFAEIRADLSRLNTDQLLALKQLALVASGGATSDSLSRNTAAGVRRTIQGTARAGRKAIAE